MHKKDIWLRLKNYHFDHIVTPGLWDQLTSRFGHTTPSEKAFAGKIARKHGWKMPFALRALTEYKKFVFLGVTGDFMVTPSKIIDVVWHEHLLFSKAYRDFCNEVLGQAFDHYPELISADEQTARFNSQYMETIMTYKKEFGLEPPEEIWGNTKFDKELIKYQAPGIKRKQKTDSSSDVITYDNTPLYNYFEDGSAADFPEFSGYEGGDAGGGGASGDWGDSGSDSGGDGGGGCSGGCGGGGD